MVKPIKITKKGAKILSDADANKGIKASGLTTGDIRRGAMPLPRDYISIKQYVKVANKGIADILAKAAILVQTENFTARDKGYGWVEVKTNLKGHDITANVRKGWFNQKMNAPRNRYSQSNEQVFYSNWIRDYGAGSRFTARRHVEGMLKVAIDTDNPLNIDLFNRVLSMSDKDVERFWNEWCAKNSDQEILDYFANSDPIDPFAEFDTNE